VDSSDLGLMDSWTIDSQQSDVEEEFFVGKMRSENPDATDMEAIGENDEAIDDNCNGTEDGTMTVRYMEGEAGRDHIESFDGNAMVDNDEDTVEDGNVTEDGGNTVENVGQVKKAKSQYKEKNKRGGKMKKKANKRKINLEAQRIDNLRKFRQKIKTFG
jgi:hypothetical protein